MKQEKERDIREQLRQLGQICLGIAGTGILKDAYAVSPHKCWEQGRQMPAVV